MAQKTTILLIAALAIAVWGVSLAGLASLQNIVNVGDNDFCKAFSIFAHMSGGLTCNKAFRQVSRLLFAANGLRFFVGEQLIRQF